ncbi:hypothetical protein MNBD_GAMMA24-1696 [hydrothermal vent metagenome]|uniref:Thioredoxin-like fold domain-containing protein n=1 Tax=hydrothermal vent metagenome TaxID=652676 RepID=A0A3B1C583_9ZZZZ
MLTDYFFMKMQRIVILLILLLSGPAFPATAGTEIQVPQTTDLQADAALAQARRLPLLIMFSLDECPYCMVVREEFLDPMQRNSNYDNKVLMRILKMDGDYVTDFDGRRVPVDDLAVRYGASVAPTVVLLDHRGRMLTKRLLGISTPDFYGVYLDAAIDKSLQRLHEQLTLVQYKN